MLQSLPWNPLEFGARGVCVFVATVFAAAVSAQPSYPVKPVRIVAPFAAGGATDVLTRLVAAELQQELKQSFIVENRAGGGGNIGMEAIARATPDGYTLGIGAGATMSINPSLHKTLPYDVTRDFAPVQMLVRVPHVFAVNRDLPPNTMTELIAYAKANPGKLSFGSPGNGTTSHLYGELLKKTAGIEMTHVPYKGGNQVRADLIAGVLQASFTTLVDAQKLVQSGQLKGMAVVAQRRVPGLPNLPTFVEIGLTRFDSENWFGVITTAGVPRDLVSFLNRRIAEIQARPDYKARLAPTGLEPAQPQSPEEFGQFIAADAKKWGAIVRELGVQTF
jgi:tripartite-type tricarboxylate transporter receptor subunit TctC